MPDFRFVVKDPEFGVERKGSFQAANLEQARQRLEHRGFIIHSLVPSGQGLVDQPAPSRVGSQRPRKTAAHALNWWESERFQQRLLACLVVLGVGLTAACWNGSGHSHKADGYQPIRVVVDGELAGYQPSQKCALQVRFPQLPARFQMDGRDVLSSTGKLHLELAFEGTHRPDYCELTVTRPGLPPYKVERLVLQGDPLSARLP